MSKWLAIARGDQDISEILPDTQCKPSKSPEATEKPDLMMVYDGCRREDADKFTTLEGTTTTPEPDDFKHGFALNGYPKTWTGKIVSLEEWRRLSQWERRGPDGRLWNGKTRQWEIADD